MDSNVSFYSIESGDGGGEGRFDSRADFTKCNIFFCLCFQVKELLKPEIQEEIADTVRQRLIQEM